ncbi:DUF1206 domain-containing protein [Parvularcula sp. LCG005]|uniref:DUF1206 domain-containing protein n=1 Tax=Parvularcula sp. LCG005 TaxID=3078805 RepID=UPI002943F03B|nr:DUF1206 domain-containing protein [Parvularcula sp. LCG005]WOI54672.1 DUF1206 domain-containing protein [Parvularcula sp. LCG005]
MNTDHKDLYKNLSRAGFAARGVTYGLIGGLAFMAAVGSGGGTTGSKGALQTLSENTFGQIVLALVALGLFGYALWRLVSAALDLENFCSDKEGIAHRLAHAGSGVFHIALGIYAFSLLMGDAGSSGGPDKYVADLMSAPFGRILVGIAGIIAFVAAGAQCKKALNEEYKSHTRIPDQNGWINPTIKTGLISRGVVFAIIGGFLIFAAATASPDNARGIGGALDWLAAQPYGSYLLAFISLGLIAFAVFSFIQARYRMIPDPQ